MKGADLRKALLRPDDIALDGVAGHALLVLPGSHLSRAGDALAKVVRQ